MGLGGVSMSQWAADILAGVGAPRTQNNINNLAAWAACEGGSASYNPFNTTLGENGATDYNSVGVKNYTSYGSGLNATISTMLQSNMASIVAALKSDAPRAQFGSAVGGSPWGTSGTCIGGSSARAGNVAPSKTVLTASSTLTSAQMANCAFGFSGYVPILPQLTIPGVGAVPGTGAGQTISACVVTKSQARAFYAALILGVGGLLILVGVGFMARSALNYRPIHVAVDTATAAAKWVAK